MWQKIKNGLRNFMMGRNGSDQLSFALLIVCIVLTLIGSLSNIAIFDYISMAGFIYAIFRMFSRNVEKRRAENARFVSFRANYKSIIKQFFNRAKNSRKYKYFKCPECKALLRLPRKVGEVTVTCGKCKHQFRQKA